MDNPIANDRRIDDFTQASAVQPLDERRFTIDIPQGWQQGRGAFGGLVLGALTRAIERCEPEPERTLRSLTGEIAGPVAVGPADIHVALVRRGTGVSTWTAVLSQGGEALARATAVLGRSRNVEHAFGPAPPAELGRPYADVGVAPLSPPMAPVFTQFLEFRVTGPLPFIGHDEPEAGGWIRFRCPPPVLAAPELVALADAWWPAAFSLEQAPRPVGTIAFTLQLLRPERPLLPERPLYHRARTIAAQEGFLVEFRELWNEHGELIALNQQTLVWIR